MKKDFISRPSGSEKHEPKVIGEVLNEYFRSDVPLASVFRKWKAKSEAAKVAEAEVETGQLFRDLFPDTFLCVNVKLISHQQGRIPVGAYLDGIITRNGEDTFLFTEKDSVKKVKTAQRNPVIFAGNCVNVHLLADDSKSFEFNRPRLDSAYRIRCFCRKAIKEIQVIERLLCNS